MINNQHIKQQVSTDGEFSLWTSSIIYKVIRAEYGYIKNTRTGENCGKCVYLYKHYFDGEKKLKVPIFDENCYEIIEDECDG